MFQTGSKRVSPRLVLLVAGMLMQAAPWARADAQAQVWYQSQIFHRLSQRWSVGNYAEARVNDGVGDLHTWILSPRVRYDLTSHVQLQLNTSWVGALNAGQTRNVDSFRLELEANPRLELSRHFQISMRNRFEWRWLDGGDEYNTRIRIRPQLDWTLARTGLFRGLYASNEVFYDFDQDRVSENRLVPLGAVFRPSEALEIRVFHLWRRTLGGTTWFNYHAIGVMASLNF
jgi:Protein of unknown function (DUF2490)